MKFRLALLALGLSFNLFAQENGDSAFLNAREAFRVGKLDQLDRAAAQLGNHPLAPYVENYRLRMFMDKDDAGGIRAFLGRNEGSFVAEKLRADWIRWLAKRNAWNEIDAEFPKLLAPEADVNCLGQQARWARGDRSVLDDAAKQWLTILEPPEACRPVLETLVLAQKVGVDEVWARARRQMEINRPAWAQTTLAYLPDSQTVDARSFNEASKNPAPWLTRLPANWAANRSTRELVAMAIARLAANDPQYAASELERRQAQLKPGEREWAWSQIALPAARSHHPYALDWYARAGNTPMSDEGYQWKVRAALRAKTWGTVRDAIEAMPPQLADKPEWVYWLGRAYRAGGRTSEADALFKRIAGQPNFYGNLADEELGRKITVPTRAAPPTSDELASARDNIAIKRSLAFFRLDLRTEAVREWNWSLRGMSDRQLLAAAELARRQQIWDRAINTAERTREEHDYSVRYLAPYDDQIRPAARDQSLDDAWVYGLMRQESRFVSNARSNVGASGLMQLMPATAKWVAKKIGLRDYNHAQVNDTQTNVLLGTSYMRIVLQGLDNQPVLASAAYNAGPGRAKKWRAEQVLEGAIYAETIPFPETRDYVKKVMSNAVYYSALFNGRPDSLKDRLGEIGPRPQNATDAAE